MLVDARKKLALLKVGSRFEDIAEAKARRDSAAAFLDEEQGRPLSVLGAGFRGRNHQGSRHPRPKPVFSTLTHQPRSFN